MDEVLAGDMPDRDRLVVLNNASIIRANRGANIDAELREMDEMGKQMQGTWHLFVADPLANAAMARGDSDAAIRAFVEVTADGSNAPEYFYRAVHPALWAKDLERARELQGQQLESGGYGAVSDARRATMTAGVAALEGRTAEAMAAYRDALRDWRATHSVWDEALTGITMAELLDPRDPEVAKVISSTREILERLGARPYLERLDRAAARETAGTDSPPRPATRPEVAVAD
jgi:hypothetical protein